MYRRMFFWIVIAHFITSMCESATIREALAKRSKPKDTDILETQFTRENVIMDHIEIYMERRSKFDPFNPQKQPLFLIPINNQHSLKPFKIEQVGRALNITETQVRRDRISRIKRRRTTSARNKELERKLLDEYNMVVLCKWKIPLPKLPDWMEEEDDQCWDEELREELKKHETGNQAELQE